MSELDHYLIPRVEDLFATLSGGRYFSKLDLSHAYQQLPSDEDSKRYVVINNHRGLFRFTRLPSGISSVPAIFQGLIKSLLQGIYLDDILVTGCTEERHLRAVLSRLHKAGLRVKQKKCAFMGPSVTYLGHRIDAQGLHPVQDQIRAIQEAPTPTSVPKLKSYLGMLSYYSKFLPKLSTILHPLHLLLRKDVPWKWPGESIRSIKRDADLRELSHILTRRWS